MVRLRALFLYLIPLVAFFPVASYAQWNPLNPVRSVQKNSDGVTLALEKGMLRFQVCTDAMVRVLYSPEREFPKVAEYVVIKSEWPVTPFDLTENADSVTLTTATLKLVTTKKDSNIVFYDAAGKKLTQANDGTLTPAEVNGEKTFHLERFTNMSDTQEAFYGLGRLHAAL